VGIALSLLAVIWRAADGPEAARSLARSDWRWLALAFVALSIQTLLSALRWQLTARQLGIALGTGHAVREYYLSQVVNQALPGGMLGDASRAVRSRAAAGLWVAGQAVVFERLAGQIALFATFGAAFAVTLAVPGGLDWPRWLLMPAALLLAIGLSLPALAYGMIYLPGAAGRAAMDFRKAFAKALAARAVWPGQVVLSMCTTVCNLGAFAFCAQAVGVDLGPGAIAALLPLILFTMLIPVSVSGWGLREGAATILLPVAGATASGALAASVAFGLVFIAAVLPGLILLGLKPRAKAGESGPLTLR
jgi:uncharacterized membrane protein YbhN (UPF0104 family)